MCLKFFYIIFKRNLSYLLKAINIFKNYLIFKIKKKKKLIFLIFLEIFGSIFRIAHILTQLVCIIVILYKLKNYIKC